MIIQRGISVWLGISFFISAVYHVEGSDRERPAGTGMNAIESELDYYHNAISLHVVQFANRLDEFFADDRILEESDETLVKVTSSVNITEGRNPTFRISLRGRLALPHLENRLQIFVDSLGADRDLSEDLSTTPETTEEDKSLFTGMRFMARETRRSRVSLDGGLRWRGGPVPFARIRGRRNFVMDPWLMRITQSVFWFEDRGFGETTRVDFDRWMHENLFFRSSSSATWSEASDGVEFDQKLSLFQSVTYSKAVGISINALGHTHPSTVIDEYGLIWRYRQRMHRDWLFVEAAPGLIFPRDENYEATPTATLSIEAFFGNTKNLER